MARFLQGLWQELLRYKIQAAQGTRRFHLEQPPLLKFGRLSPAHLLLVLLFPVHVWSSGVTSGARGPGPPGLNPTIASFLFSRPEKLKSGVLRNVPIDSSHVMFHLSPMPGTGARRLANQPEMKKSKAWFACAWRGSI